MLLSSTPLPPQAAFFLPFSPAPQHHAIILPCHLIYTGMLSRRKRYLCNASSHLFIDHKAHSDAIAIAVPKWHLLWRIARQNSNNTGTTENFAWCHKPKARARGKSPSIQSSGICFSTSSFPPVYLLFLFPSIPSPPTKPPSVELPTEKPLKYYTVVLEILQP